MEKIVVLMSGGIDSFLMCKILSENYELYPLFVDYGHLAANQEQKTVLKQIKFLNLNSAKLVKIPDLGLKNSLTLEEEYKDDFYPGRNLLLLIIAAQLAIGMNIERIALGIIRSERVFSDCTSFFIQRAEQLISDGVNKQITIFTPISDLQKNEVVELAKELELPLSHSYSCQKGDLKECGKCLSCLELDKAILENK